MATSNGIFMDSFAPKAATADKFARFEVETDAEYTDIESDDDEFSFSHRSTDRTDASLEVFYDELSDIEVEPSTNNAIERHVPLWLVVDSSHRVQAIQSKKLVSLGAAASVSTSHDADSSRITRKRVMPKRPPGVFLPPGVFRPPGVFFRPPPGLLAPPEQAGGH
eukprot:TRINITY_DN18407_c0_g1_i1.p2 TRINITY_DN18407_c0_g1~~TRINITY_DN18407_c0_g1_i1.p2  ORF type:complete len:165 (-),score=26.10 TRINITY_DN18407_c0_g1_i1:577-1071(-)